MHRIIERTCWCVSSTFRYSKWKSTKCQMQCSADSGGLPWLICWWRDERRNLNCKAKSNFESNLPSSIKSAYGSKGKENETAYAKIIIDLDTQQDNICASKYFIALQPKTQMIWQGFGGNLTKNKFFRIFSKKKKKFQIFKWLNMENVNLKR